MPKTLHAELQGKVVDTRLRRHGDRYVYDVTVLTDKGIKQVLQFGDRSGELLDTAEDDSEDGAR